MSEPELRVEFTTEPFVIGEVPEHASAAYDVVSGSSAKTEFGPFGTAATGDREEVLALLPEVLRAALNGGAKRITLQITTSDANPRTNSMHGALDRMLLEIEVEMGQSIEAMNRFAKQEVVRRLQERGAFNLRGSVEDVADHLGVSRFTVYNYLNASS
jgi:uncharacterized protein YqgV (UPF0045/DUF77 family)